MTEIELPSDPKPRGGMARAFAAFVTLGCLAIHSASLLQMRVPDVVGFAFAFAAALVAGSVVVRLLRINPDLQPWSTLRPYTNSQQRRPLRFALVYATILPFLFLLTEALGPRATVGSRAGEDAHAAVVSEAHTRRFMFVLSGVTGVAGYFAYFALGVLPRGRRSGRATWPPESGPEHGSKAQARASNRDPDSRTAPESSPPLPVRPPPSARWEEATWLLSLVCGGMHLGALVGVSVGVWSGICALVAAVCFGATAHHLGAMWPEHRLHRVLFPRIPSAMLLSLAIGLAYVVFLSSLGVLAGRSASLLGRESGGRGLDALSLSALALWLSWCCRAMLRAAREVNAGTRQR